MDPLIVLIALVGIVTIAALCFGYFSLIATKEALKQKQTKIAEKSIKELGESRKIVTRIARKITEQ